MTEDNIIDYAILGEAAALLKKKFPMILDVYIEDARGYVNGIFAGIENGDARAVAQSAHPLKSASEGMGVVKIHALAKAMEAEAISITETGASIVSLKSAAEKIRDTLELTIPLLEEYARKHAA